MDNDRINALIKLGLWLAFLSVLVVLARHSEPVSKRKIESPKETEEKVVLTYEEKLDNLTNNFSYQYDIKVKSVDYEYIGTKMGVEYSETPKEYGYRTITKNNSSNKDYLEYFIENDWTYEVKNGGLDKINSALLFKGLNTDNIDISKIKESILNIEYTQNNDEYVYNLDNKTITIKTDEKSITNIKIVEKDDVYDLYFSSVNEIKEVNYQK